VSLVKISPYAWDFIILNLMLHRTIEARALPGLNIKAFRTIVNLIFVRCTIFLFIFMGIVRPVAGCLV